MIWTLARPIREAELAVPYPRPFIFCLKTPEHLKVTTLLDPSIKSSPVCGFLPLRSLLSFTQNFPNPLINTSSPFARVRLF